jgi:hypothetical protein
MLPSASAMSDNEGAFLLNPIEPYLLYRLSVCAGGYAPAEVAFGPVGEGRESVIAVALDVADGQLRGRVLSDAGQPVPWAVVICRGRGERFSVTCDSDGAFELGGLVKDDTVALSVMSTDFAPLDTNAVVTSEPLEIRLRR